MKTAVIVNLKANYGKAEEQWKSIAPDVLKLLPPETRVVTFRPFTNIEHVVEELLAEGTQVFISAGGDGSANYLLNILLRVRSGHVQDLYIGGIGLGAINDFIKPTDSLIQEVPTRINIEHATKTDIGMVGFLTPEGGTKSRYFIANSSMGVSAEAIRHYNNQENRFIQITKKRWVILSVIYTALNTILSFRNFPAAIIINGLKRIDTTLSNLAVLKCSYVPGNLHYDDPVTRDNGLFGVEICYGMRKPELIKTLLALTKGHFRHRPKTLTLQAKQVEVRADFPVALEIDGEVYITEKALFTVIPQVINLLGC